MGLEVPVLRFFLLRGVLFVCLSDLLPQWAHLSVIPACLFIGSSRVTSVCF
jgi:hypothetical protein